MALIMFWGMFGFGEMVSSISFMGDGGRGCWCACPLTVESATFKCFTLNMMASEIRFAGLFYYTVQYEIPQLCFVLFFFKWLFWENIIKHLGTIWIWRELPIFPFKRPLQNSCFQTSCATLDVMNWTLLCCLLSREAGPVVFIWSIHQILVKVRGVILLIMWLCGATETPGGEVFVRSFVSHYPEGFSAAYFFCSKSPGYTSVISLLPSPPSQPQDTVGID